MALARVLEIIAFLIYIQESCGQFNSLMNNNPTLGQNNPSQGFQSVANIKSVKDKFTQNENAGKNINFNPQNQVTSKQSSMPQASLSAQYSLQQSQNFPQLINQQTQISNLQQPLYQTQPSYTQQTPSVQPSYNFLESSSAYAPIINAGNINLHQQGGTPTIQPVPMQVSQSIPVSNSYTPTYSSAIYSVPTYGGQRMELSSNFGGNYLVPISAMPYSIPEGQVENSYPTVAYATVLATPNPKIFGNTVMPYQNQNFGTLENSSDNLCDTPVVDEVSSLDSDKITNVLMAMLKTPKKLSKYLQNQESSYAPYTPYKMNQDTKSSSLKTLIPIILNLLKERREGCGCHSSCKCNRRNRNKKDSNSHINEVFADKKDLKKELFHNDESEEEIHREHKNQGIVKTSISDISTESNENDTDYDDSSEEDEDSS